MSHRKTPPLPTIACSLAVDEVRRRVRELAMRGRMPGFIMGKGEIAFEAQSFGKQFDYRLFAILTPGELRFELRLCRRTPMILAVLLAVTLWPGVWLTDSMLKTYFDWYTMPTWIWYIPLTVIPVPFMWRRAVVHSRAAAEDSARELIERIRDALAPETGA